MGTSREAPGAPPLSREVVNASEKFLSQRDDDSRGASHVAQPVLVLVLDRLADEFGAVGAQAGHGVVNVFDREHDLPKAQRVRRGVRWLSPEQIRMAELRQLNPPVAVWGPHHGDVDLDAFEPAEAVHPGPLDRHLALKRHAEGGEEGDGGPEVVDDDGDMVHSLDRHVPRIRQATRDDQGRLFSRVGRLTNPVSRGNAGSRRSK